MLNRAPEAGSRASTSGLAAGFQHLHAGEQGPSSATVSSVDPLSTTTTGGSSGSARSSETARTASAARSRVMTTTETLGHAGMEPGYPRGRCPNRPGDLRLDRASGRHARAIRKPMPRVQRTAP